MMRRLVILTAALIVGLTGVIPAGADPAFRHATGNVRTDDGLVRLHFSVFDDPGGDHGTIQFSSALPGDPVLDYTTTVTDVVVDSDAESARFLSRIPQGNGLPSGLWIVDEVTDGGSPGTAADGVAWYWTWDQSEAQGWMATGLPSGHDYVIVAGNIVIHA